jgi:hypothetical protein
MRRFLPAALIALSLAFSGTLSAQLNFPEIPYDAVDPLNLPANLYLGEAAGVATNSKGDIFVYTRTGTPVITTAGARNVSHGGSRLFQFDRTGKFVREMGQGAYGFLQAQQVRVDPQDNIWVVDQMSTQVIKFDPNGRIQMIFSRKPERCAAGLPLATPPDTYALVPGVRRAARAGGWGTACGAAPGGRAGGPPGSGRQARINCPTDVTWDSRATSAADGHGNSRRATTATGSGSRISSTGTGPASSGGASIRLTRRTTLGRRDNKRIQVFDSEGTFKTQYRNVGSPWAICITPGPRQFMYVSNSNPPNNLDYDGEILKMTLDGRIVGKFGRAGKLLKEFGTVNAIDCRTENERG